VDDVTPEQFTIVRLKAERDAAIAVAIHAGTSTFGLTDDDACRLVGRSLKAWLDPDVAEVTRRYGRAVRKAAGLGTDR
jgi:hypothetical protein